MEIEIVTKEDFNSFKIDIVNEIKKILQAPGTERKEWLKTSDVLDLLSCSQGTLQNLRVNGTLPYTKMGGTIYYSRKNVIMVLEGNMKNDA